MYAEKTSVTVARSRAELQELVKKHGATDIISGELSGEGFAFVAFRMCSACAGRPARIRDALEELAAAAGAASEARDLVRTVSPESWLAGARIFDKTLARLREATIRGQQLLDETRWPVAFDGREERSARNE